MTPYPASVAAANLTSVAGGNCCGVLLVGNAGTVILASQSGAGMLTSPQLLPFPIANLDLTSAWSEDTFTAVAAVDGSLWVRL
jgi:hypothetical protein